jgi:hypothetical protein
MAQNPIHRVLRNYPNLGEHKFGSRASRKQMQEPETAFNDTYVKLRQSRPGAKRIM